MRIKRQPQKGTAITEYLVITVSAVFVLGLALTTGFVNPIKRHTCTVWFGNDKEALFSIGASWGESTLKCEGTIGGDTIMLY